MLFTNGRLQSFEQLMKQPPYCPTRPPKKPVPMKPENEPKSPHQKETSHGNQ